MKPYTVTLSGPEREDGENPYDYVVLAYHAAGAVAQAMSAHLRDGDDAANEDDIWVERCRVGLHPMGFYNDLRTEIA
jgi:hypothetical protein